MENIILGLYAYFFPVSSILKQKRTMRHGMMNPRGLKVRRYTFHVVGLKGCLTLFPGLKLSYNIYVKEMNKTLFNIMPNSWSKQAYLQVFYCESITFNKYFRMFDRMGIAESIYKGVVEISY